MSRRKVSCSYVNLSFFGLQTRYYFSTPFLLAWGIIEGGNGTIMDDGIAPPTSHFSPLRSLSPVYAPASASSSYVLTTLNLC